MSLNRTLLCLSTGHSFVSQQDTPSSLNRTLLCLSTGHSFVSQQDTPKSWLHHHCPLSFRTADVSPLPLSPNRTLQVHNSCQPCQFSFKSLFEGVSPHSLLQHDSASFTRFTQSLHCLSQITLRATPLPLSPNNCHHCH